MKEKESSPGISHSYEQLACTTETLVRMAKLVSLGAQRQPRFLDVETTKDKESNLSLHIWALLK